MSSFLFFNYTFLVSETGRKNMLKLSERMVRSFFRDLSASTNNWRPLDSTSNGDQDPPRLMAKKTYDDNPVKPTGGITYFTTSLGLQIPARKVFDYLRDINYRASVCTFPRLLIFLQWMMRLFFRVLMMCHGFYRPGWLVLY